MRKLIAVLIAIVASAGCYQTSTCEDEIDAVDDVYAETGDNDVDAGDTSPGGFTSDTLFECKLSRDCPAGKKCHKGGCIPLEN